MAGLLNGWLITRLRIPPLIVTLGSMSLFRGLAEGITGGVREFHDSARPSRFCFSATAIFSTYSGATADFPASPSPAFWLFMHRSIIGRAMVAIGFSPEGARYAGIPVNRRFVLVYLL